MNKIISLLKMDFLIKEDSFKNWRMIFFISSLALIMISSGHLADDKVFQISKLNEKIRVLKSEFVDQRAELMSLKMETYVTQKLLERGIIVSKSPPIKLYVTNE
ncbi:MAG: S-adenosyl-methyltransferase [Flavobacteriaceae bacterium]|nr:S-adenosyl-methyltransferase [Flavobacteriaceae bacterium]